jgi:hypothetical protein
MAIQYAVLVIWVAAIVGLVVVHVYVLGVFVFVAVSSFAIWQFVNPRRSWWGPGPRSVLADPLAFKRYQIRMNVAMAIALFVAAIVPVVIALSLP